MNLSKGLLNSSTNQTLKKFYTPLAQIDFNKKKVNIFFYLESSFENKYFFP